MSTRTRKTATPRSKGAKKGRRQPPFVIDRDRLHYAVELLPEDQFETAFRMIGFLLESADPFLWKAANVPDDDEPETEEERRAVEEGMADIRAGRVVSHEEVKRLLLGPK